MTQTADFFERRDSYRGAFFAATALHVAIVLVVALPAWLAGKAKPFGEPNGGGAIGVGIVGAIPRPHEGRKNLLANDTASEIPQQVTQPDKRSLVEEKEPPKDAIRLKGRDAKKKESRRLPSFDQIAQNQVTSSQPQALSSDKFAQAPGSGQVGTSNTTLGTRFAGYAQQIRQLVAQQWRTGDVDQRRQHPPPVIATFDLMRDGTIRNLRLLHA